MKKFLAEFIGTFILVALGCGTAAAVGCNGAEANGAYILTAFAFGLSIVAGAYSIGNISGCHVNPAVSLALFLSKKMSAKDFGMYVVAQILGAIVASAVLAYLLGVSSGLGTNGLYSGDVLKSIVVEIVLTFIFILAILGVTSKVENGLVAGLVIGLTLTLVHIFGIHFTGTSVNPARSLAPALFVGGEALANVWVFIVAPFIGGALAAVTWSSLNK